MELILAPIHGLTNAYYRNSFSEVFGGFDTYMTPFLSPTDMRIDDSIIFDDVKPSNNNSDLHIIPQLLGNKADDFTYFGNRIVEYGYQEINWNLGCPQRNITKKLKGSGLLSRPELIESFLEEVCRDKDYALSVKIRLGQYDIEEGIKVIDILNQYPLEGITIHPRTAKQMYGGSVDLEGFELLYKQSKHEVTYNGDIKTIEDYESITKRFPEISKIMIGRGALRNPTLPMSIKGQKVSDKDRQKLVMKFHDLMYSYYLETVPTDIRIMGKMKEFWPYLAWMFDPDGGFMKEVRLSENTNEYQQLIEEVKKKLKV